MTQDPLLPQGWLPHLQRHLRDLFKMAQTYKWETCRAWSEEVFASIESGDLLNWEDYALVKDIQRDTIQRFRAHDDDRKYREAAAETTPYAAQTPAPCYQWNRGNCDQSAPHGPLHKQRLHVCAWCLNKRLLHENHKEPDCPKKIASQKTDEKKTVQKDF